MMKKNILPYIFSVLLAVIAFSCEPLLKPTHHFSILFDANGGEGDMEMLVVDAGAGGDNLTENAFTREGYVFVGWNTAPDGSGTSYGDAAEIAPNQNLKLYAQWERQVFSLYFDRNGGGGSMDVQFLKYDLAEALNENAFVRGGFVFAGWNTSPDGSGTSYKDKADITIMQETTLYAQWKLLVSGTENGYSYIDLGLPSELKWAISNVGGNMPESTGDYFAWGETAPKKEYSWATYKWSTYSNGAYKMTKYNTDSQYGTMVDNKESLELEDDAAHVNMGDKWRMPTGTEYAELFDYCTWTWTTQNGISGYIVKSKTNDNSMFLPAAGWYVNAVCSYTSEWGFYWLNTLATGVSPLHAYSWNFSSTLYKQYYDHYNHDGRYYGFPVRAVYAEFAVVTFDANGGEGEMPAQRFTIGESQALMSNTFARAGYNFTGWNTAPDGSGTAYAEHQIIDPQQNLTLYAQWKREPVVVTFDANGGSGSMEPQLFDPEVLQALPANTFTRDGHMFTGWNTAPDGSGTSFNDQAEVMIGGSLTLYAQWYAVSGFENEHPYVDLGLPSGTKWATCNVGATAPEGYGDYFAWGETSPKDNYNWSYYKHNRRSGTVNSLLKYNNNVNNGVVDNKTTLDAEDDAATVNWGGRWRIPSQKEQNELITNCNLTWVQQNGVNGYKLTSKINGNSIFLPAAGYRYNADVESVGTKAYYWANSLYAFGTFDAVNLYYERTLVSVGKYSSRCIGNTIRAVISDDTPQTTIYTLTFNANGGSGTMATQTFEAGVSQAIAANAFTRSGYNFIGWNSNADGSGTSYTDKQSITLTQDVTLYAQWERIKYNLSFDANGGEGTMTAQVFEAGVSQALVSNAFTRSGYNFIGWNSNADGSGTSYADGQEITLTQDMTLYAQWEKQIVHYTVNFDANGGEGTMAAQVFEAGVSQTLVSNAFTRSGYNFIAWNSNADGSGTSYTDGQEITLTQDMTLYAQWEKQIVNYTVNFNANGGEGTMTAQVFEAGVSQALVLNAFTREGYNFIGWNSNADGSGTSYTDGQEITLTQDMTLYAQWELIGGSGGGGSTPDTDDTHEWVDLGLPSGIKWATCNIGATTPEGYGDYFAWGEISPKRDYTWKSYIFRISGDDYNDVEFCKYVLSSEIGYEDNKTTLEFSDDAARVNWGGKWRIPTLAEQDELRDHCTWTWTYKNGVYGYDVTSKTNGNSIFLPAAGHCYGVSYNNVGSHGDYWSSSLDSDTKSAYGLTFYSNNVNWNSDGRYSGRTIRAVFSENDTPSTFVKISFNANGGEGTMAMQFLELGVSQLLVANIFTRTGYEFVGWNTKSDGSGTSYADRQSINPTHDVTLYAQWKIQQEVSGSENGHEYVDLGLPSGLKWATCNVGANLPEAYGDYFAWGETSPKDDYSWSTYKYCNGSAYTMTKYCTSSSYGTVDNKTTLEVSDDAARVNWGGKWRMPTNAEQAELRDYCTWTWTTQNGVNGYKLISKINGNSLFLPAAGYRHETSLNNVESTNGRYWSSSLSSSYSSSAYDLFFRSGEVVWYSPDRYYGYTVRAVFSDDTPQTTIYTLTFNANGGTGTMAAQTFEAGVLQTIAANTFTRDGYTFIGWNTSPDGSGTAYTDQQEITLTQDITLYAQWQEKALKGIENGHEWVDLGLPSGLKWATSNVGATTFEDYGDYFTWGETSPKYNYDWSTYKYCNGSSSTLTKYNTNSSNGTVDNKTTLELSDDAARVTWGGNWRIPTYAELDELRNNCTWTWTTQNGVNGYKVTSKTNGNSIFLPAAGYRYDTSVRSVGSGGLYWSSSLKESDPRSAYYLYFSSGDMYWNYSYRSHGRTIRAVCP